jgi:hypothetical protein
VAYARTADLAEEVATNSASSSDRSGDAPPAAETSPAPGSAIRPYIESMTESLGQAGGRPVLRWEGADTTGSELLAAIYRHARAGVAGHRTRRPGGDVRAEPARGPRCATPRTCSARPLCTYPRRPTPASERRCSSISARVWS